MKLDVSELTGDDVRWWELAGHATESLTEAWRRVHYACQAVAEIGKAFGDPSDGLVRWFDGVQMLDGFLAGPVVGSDKRVMAALRLWDMHLFVISQSGEAIGELPLEDHTLEHATGWIVDSVLNILDEPVRQPTDPATGLPDHALGQGGVFAPPNQFPQAELIRLYANANAILDAIARQLHAQGAVIDPDRMSIGVANGGIRLGMTPPGEWSTHGCWFVFGLAQQVDLEFGRWVNGVAVFDLVDLHGVEDSGEQRRRVATFFADAFNSNAE